MESKHDRQWRLPKEQLEVCMIAIHLMDLWIQKDILKQGMEKVQFQYPDAD